MMRVECFFTKDAKQSGVSRIRWKESDSPLNGAHCHEYVTIRLG
jgi:hypothetical protein